MKDPKRPGLVVMLGQDPRIEREVFVRRHGRPPDHVLVVELVDARKATPHG